MPDKQTNRAYRRNCGTPDRHMRGDRGSIFHFFELELSFGHGNGSGGRQRDLRLVDLLVVMRNGKSVLVKLEEHFLDTVRILQEGLGINAQELSLIAVQVDDRFIILVLLECDSSSSPTGSQLADTGHSRVICSANRELTVIIYYYGESIIPHRHKRRLTGARQIIRHTRRERAETGTPANITADGHRPSAA